MWQRLFFALVVRPFVTLFIGVRVVGREHLPDGDPFLLISNHSSHLDTIMLLSLFPDDRLSHIRPVAAADYWERNRVVSWIAHRLINVLAIPRTMSREAMRASGEDADPRTAMISALQSGTSLIVFPEGTRGRDEEMAPFKAGIVRVIEGMPDVPIVPVLLVNLGRSMPKGARIPVPLFCEVRIGAPFRPVGSRREIVSALENAVTSLR